MRDSKARVKTGKGFSAVRAPIADYEPDASEEEWQGEGGGGGNQCLNIPNYPLPCISSVCLVCVSVLSLIILKGEETTEQ